MPFAILWVALGDRVSAGMKMIASLGGTAATLILMFVWLILKMPSVIEAEQLAERATLQTALDRQVTEPSAMNEIADHVAATPPIIAKFVTSEQEYAQWQAVVELGSVEAQRLVQVHFGEACAKSFLHITRLEDPSTFKTFFNDEHQGLKRSCANWGHACSAWLRSDLWSEKRAEKVAKRF